jgi:hypothetical protein
MYPSWMLSVLDEPWIALVAVLVAIQLWTWSPKASVFILLLIIAFVADIHVFAKSQPLEEPYPLSSWTSSTATNSDAVKKAMDYWDGWFGANGDVWFYDPISKDYGPAKIPLAKPIYPLYNGLNEPLRGPAPFIPSPIVEN